MSKISDRIRAEYLEQIMDFFRQNGEDVLRFKSNAFCLPWASGDDEGYVAITVSIPTGSKESGAFDGYSEAESYAIESKAKAEAKAERERKAAEKAEKDRARRAAAAEKKKQREESK